VCDKAPVLEEDLARLMARIDELVARAAALEVAGRFLEAPLAVGEAENEEEFDRIVIALAALDTGEAFRVEELAERVNFFPRGDEFGAFRAALAEELREAFLM
jgi:hypothetical protein